MKLCCILLLILPLVWGQGTDTDDDKFDFVYENLKETLEKLKIVDQKNEELRKKIAALEEQVKNAEKNKNAQSQQQTCPANIGTGTKCETASTGCYCLISQKSTWAEAENICIQKGARLVSIETSQENDVIKKIFSTKAHFDRNGGAGFRLWTSGSDKADKGRWIWTSTGKPVQFTDWGKNEPSTEFEGEDFLDLWIAADESGWNNSPNNPGEFGWEMFPLCEL